MYQHTMKILNFATEKANLESKSNTYEEDILNYRSVIYCCYYTMFGKQGNVTGIQQVKFKTVTTTNATYNLSGQLVTDGYRGIVIRNGKKMVIK